MNADFRTIALALQPYISDTYNLLNATDAVLQALPSAIAANKPSATHEVLVRMCLHSEAILDAMRQNKKIDAIKALRYASTEAGWATASLREAKDAVEDERVMVYFNNNQEF